MISFPSAFLAVLILYLVATLLYLLRLILGRPIFSVLGLRIVIFAALLQSLALVAHAFQSDRPFISSYLENYQLSSLVLAVFFIVLCFTKRFYAAGPLFVTLIDVFCILSLSYDHPDLLMEPARGRGYLIFHLSSIFLSLSVFAIGLISAILFLIAEKQIKTKQHHGWVAKLPPLASLDEVHHKALYAGFFLFTFSILTGAGFSKVTTGHYIAENFKQILSFVLWVFFAVLLNFRVRQGWQGHKGVILSLTGFVGLVLLFFVGLK